LYYIFPKNAISFFLCQKSLSALPFSQESGILKAEGNAGQLAFEKEKTLF